MSENVQTSTWTAFKIVLVQTLLGTKRAIKYSDRLAERGR